MAFKFGPFSADRATYRVWTDAGPIALSPKLLDLLFYLLDHPGTLVTKDALLDTLWAGANVTENAVAQAVSELRDALGDKAGSPTYILTVSRRGYRFVAPVNVVDVPAADTTSMAFRASASADPPLRAIAVVDFVNVTGDADVNWLAAGIAETVTIDLGALDGFRVIDRWRVAAAARTSSTVHAIGAAVGAALAVTGSYQRIGPQLRVTARIVDLESGEAIADAKVDGALSAAFDVQDAIVPLFAQDLGRPMRRPSGRVGVRETSSLDAYRAYTEGLLKIESLDTDLVTAAMADFERAIACDSGYAMAYTGLASAEFVAYEMSRSTACPNVAALRSGIAHARRAVQLDDELAEAHATLSFLLVSDLAVDEARVAAVRAVALEPDSWRHQYRLGHALWGSARLRAFERALALYPQFPYATFETAMLHVARGHVDEAERAVRRRMDDAQRLARPADRFPAVGFHWLLGAIEAAGERHESSVLEFDRELAQGAARQLYGPEYRAEAFIGRGHAQLALGEAPLALGSFRAGAAEVPGHLRALIGEGMTLEALGYHREATRAWKAVEDSAAAIRAQGRAHQSWHASACVKAARGDSEGTAQALWALLDSLLACHVGWTLPLEPLFAPLRRSGALDAVLRRLAEQAQ